MSLKSITHNKEAVNQLISFVEKRETTGSFLFYGANSMILKAFAIHFAKALNCLNLEFGCSSCSHCRELERGIFPDMYYYHSRSGIDELRKLINEISLSGQDKSKKVIIIEKANELTTIEANILLKTVEEPPKETFFVFTSHSKQVLPTIFSRCVPVKFTPIKKSEVDIAKESFLILNSSISSVSLSQLPVEKVYHYNEVPELLENYNESIEWEYAINSAIIHYMNNRKSISAIERLEWIFRIEKSLNKNRKLTEHFLTLCLYKSRENSYLDRMIQLKNSLRINLSIKVVLVRFFEYL